MAADTTELSDEQREAIRLRFLQVDASMSPTCSIR